MIKFSLSTQLPLYNTFVWGEPLNLRLWHLASWTLATSLYGPVQSIF